MNTNWILIPKKQEILSKDPPLWSETKRDAE